MSKSKFNPRIIVTVKNESTVCKGVYICAKGNEYSFNRAFNDENQAVDYLNNLRENNAEFSIQINRTNWKA